MKTFSGTWFEFQHHSIPEGKYWNAACRAFSAEQWALKVDEIASLGMNELVIMCTALPRDDSAECYYSGGPYPFAPGMACDDPIEATLTAADARHMRVFMSCGFYGNWTHTVENMTSADVTRRAFEAMEHLLDRYGAHPSFGGWYYPDETQIGPYFDERFIRYVNAYSAHAHRLDAGKKILIAPYGTNLLRADDVYTRQLAGLDVDYVAYQDEVGVRKSRPEDTRAYYEALRAAHDRAGRAALWCDMEIFDFEGDVYRSALIPADAARLARQMQSVSDYVDKVLIYQYQGMLNRPGTAAFCGHAGSTAYYEDVARLLSDISTR